MLGAGCWARTQFCLRGCTHMGIRSGSALLLYAGAAHPLWALQWPPCEPQAETPWAAAAPSRLSPAELWVQPHCIPTLLAQQG